ncbi:hypothetical protein [Staphylococcus hominis]|uniref:hypothetical protein n=1 Tax=Staphylococcus hominis TaxID=1290 RepID=UPI00115F6715|nr:hypothetical protein [Staphylococcus hominis]TRL32951.1 hypothetical protein FNL05_06120 [Staphylococcus hominis]
MAVERTVYNGWAFSENAKEKMKINSELYQEIKNKYSIYRSDNRYAFVNNDINFDDYDLIIERVPKYKHAIYNIHKNDTELGYDEMLLVCDDGNLCFGGQKTKSNQYTVWED